MALPKLPERRQLVQLYYNQCLAPPPTPPPPPPPKTGLRLVLAVLTWPFRAVTGAARASATAAVALVWPPPPRPRDPGKGILSAWVPAALERLAASTEGFSGREIHKLFISLQVQGVRGVQKKLFLSIPLRGVGHVSLAHASRAPPHFPALLVRVPSLPAWTAC